MTLLVVALRARAALVLAALVVVPASAARGQITLTHTEDASPIPRGMVRLRVTNAWTRYDQRFGTNGLTSLGDELSADSLGVAQLPLLAPIQSSIRSLARDPATRLSLGRLVTRGDARIVTTPLALEIGVTRRLSVGVVVPVVQARRTVTVDVNSSTTARANVGFVGVGQRAIAATTNRAAVASYTAAASQMAALISRCQATPSGSGCAAVTSDPAAAAAAAALASQFATAAQVLGTDETTVRVAPRAAGTVAVAIEAQRAALNAQLQQFLGAGATQTSAVYFAPSDFSYIDLQGRNGTQGLLQSAYGGGLDSIRTTERLGIGDISVGAQYLVFDRFQRDSLPLRGIQSRLAVGGEVRFATGRPDTITNLVDIGTGEGAAVTVRAAYDLVLGRLGGTAAAHFTKAFARTAYAPAFGDPDAGFPLPTFAQRQRTAGSVTGLDLTPRYLLSETFALDAHYGLERTGSARYSATSDVATADQPLYCSFVSCAAPAATTRTAHRVGLGLRYSTVDAYSRGMSSFPVEASYTHLTTVSGDPGVPKISREQIQLRVFYRLFGP